jgi:hypothetical protein
MAQVKLTDDFGIAQFIKKTPYNVEKIAADSGLSKAVVKNIAYMRDKKISRVLLATLFLFMNGRYTPRITRKAYRDMREISPSGGILEYIEEHGKEGQELLSKLLDTSFLTIDCWRSGRRLPPDYKKLVFRLWEMGVVTLDEILSLYEKIEENYGT